MSARTIIAAPVIWFGSWLWLLIGLLRMRSRGAVFVGLVWEIKKGPKRPHVHRLHSGWPQPPGAMHLGTTTIRSLVIILRIYLLGLPKGCANIAIRPRMSRQWRVQRDFWKLSGLPGIRRVRKCCNDT